MACMNVHSTLGLIAEDWAFPHLKPILNSSKLRIETQIEMKLYIFLECSTVKVNYNTEKQIEKRDGLINTSLSSQQR